MHERSSCKRKENIAHRVRSDGNGSLCNHHNNLRRRRHRPQPPSRVPVVAEALHPVAACLREVEAESAQTRESSSSLAGAAT